MPARPDPLNQLDKTIARLLAVYQGMQHPEMVAIGEWTAKDLLGHIVFWHESFAQNVCDIASGVKPRPLKGKLSDLNQQSVEEMRLYSIETLISRLEAAHRDIQENILNPRLEQIPYRKGSRDYTPEEHLEIVNRHISGHLKEIENVLSASG
jgi:hypothetical protein